MFCAKTGCAAARMRSRALPGCCSVEGFVLMRAARPVRRPPRAGIIKVSTERLHPAVHNSRRRGEHLRMRRTEPRLEVFGGVAGLGFGDVFGGSLRDDRPAAVAAFG